MTEHRKRERIDADAVEKWEEHLGGRGVPAGLNTKSMRGLVFLALLERGEKETSYADLEGVLNARKVMAEAPTRHGLRVAVSDLAKFLASSNNDFAVTQRKVGKEARFRLLGGARQRLGLDRALVELQLPSPVGNLEDIARALVRDRVVPFHSLYVVPPAVTWWSRFAMDEQGGSRRAKYEGGAWQSLGVRGRLLGQIGKNRTLCVVGLGVGDGLGEIEILRRITEDSDFSGVQIHYLALDSSPGLLIRHVHAITDVFAADMSTGRLIVAAGLTDFRSFIHGNDESGVLAALRAQAVQAGLKTTLLPTDAPTLVTYLGNSLGAEDPSTAHRLVQGLRDEIRRETHLECLIGVSVANDKHIEFPQDVFRFLLETPNYLWKVARIIDVDEEDDEDEFSVPTDPAVAAHRCPSPEPAPYSAPHGLRGVVYRFYYRTKGTVRMKGERPLPPDTQLLLHPVTQFERESLRAFFQNCGFAYEEDEAPHIEVAGGREYAVVCVHRPGTLEVMSDNRDGAARDDPAVG